MVTHCSMSDDGYPEVFSPSESDKSAGADAMIVTVSQSHLKRHHLHLVVLV